MNIELAKKLSDASGISGFEKNIAKIIKEELSEYKETFDNDNLGSLITVKKGQTDGPKIMLSAHMDEVGFIINRITDDGFLYFSPVGGWWSQVLLGQKVKVINKNNKEFIGVIGSKPPHILPKDKRDVPVEIKDMYIDLGAKDKEQILSNDINIGDMIVPHSVATELMDEDLILGKAWDDRIGCLVLIDVMQKLRDINHPNTVYGVFSVQEEIGLKGARTAATKIKSDIALALDTGIAGDTPGISENEAEAKLGKGPQVTIMDGGMIIDESFKKFIFETAQENSIEIQPEILIGGTTDAASIQLTNNGVMATCISLATRYLHSHNSIISKSDFDNTVKLIIKLIEKLDQKKLIELHE